MARARTAWLPVACVALVALTAIPFAAGWET